MADIDTVLELLVNDSSFREKLTADPAAALQPYDLSPDDLQLLASSLDRGDDRQRGVEQRTSKSAVVGLLASLGGSGGGGEAAAERLNSKPEGSVTVPLTSSRGGGADLPTGTRGGEIRPPVLDGASKDTAFLDQDAPADEALKKLPGRPKWSDISLKREGAGASDQLAPDAPTDEAVRRLPGRPKVGEITVTKSSTPGGGDGAVADQVRSPGQRQWSDLSVERESSSGAADQFAPADPDGESAKMHVKIKFEPGPNADAAPPSPAGAEEDLHWIKLKNADLAASTKAPPDFLSIEDE